ncbi:hypothetical protein K8S19_09695 [bacterium]|nr:hypothetical protein [bacterium]
MKDANIKFENRSDDSKKLKVISDSEFTNFLTKTSLYSKIKAVSNYRDVENTYSHPNHFCDKTFAIRCPKEKEVQTFKTELNIPENFYGFENVSLNNKLPDSFDEKTRYLDLVINLVGECQSCGTKVHYLLKVYSDRSWDEREKGINIYIKKIGQFPPYDISLDKDVEKYLIEEDVSNYKKALVSLSISYGIGAFAYFRRIIENEIKRIIKDISLIEFDGSEKVQEAMKSFDSDHQMSNLIDVLNKFLPMSFKQLGNNPIRLLYEQLSEGIHSFSEQECLEKAELINVILTFVIKKINEEKFELSEVKTAMKKLKNGY